MTKEKTIYELVENGTGQLMGSYSFSVRIRVKKVNIEEYKKTHVLMNKIKNKR